MCRAKWAARLAAVVLGVAGGCGEGGSPPSVAYDPAPSGNRKLSLSDQSRWFPKGVKHDAGKVDEGAKIVKRFPFINPEKGPRLLKTLQKNCACAWTTVSYGGRSIKAVSPLVPPLEIAPGTGGEIEVVLDTAAIDGPKTAQVEVLVGDRKSGRDIWMGLAVKATSILYFWTEPPQLGLGEIGSADVGEFDFRILTRKVKRWKILKCDHPPTYKVNWARTSYGANDAWRVRGRVGPGLPPGDHSAGLVFHTDYQGRKVNFKVNVVVTPPWEVDPPTGLNFAKVKAGREKTMRFVVRSLTRKRRLKLKGLRLVETTRPIAHFRLDPRETRRGSRYDVTFTALGTLPAGPFKGVVLVRTDDPAVSEQPIPFHGYVR